MLRPLFHLTVVGVNSFVICYDQLYINLPLDNKAMADLPLRSRSMFLTIWCLVLQTIYHFISFLNDIVGTDAPAPKKPPIIRRIRDNLFILAFSVSIYVSIAFWGIYFGIDKEMIFPEYIEKLYHPLFNHIMHTTVSLFILIELVTSNITLPSRKVGLFILYSYLVCYTCWYFFIYWKTGAWVYPIYNHLNWAGRAIFTFASLAIAGLFYLLGEKLNSVLNVKHTQNYINGSSKGKKKRS